MRTPVYLDHHATTPPDPRILDLMHRVEREHFGNPASAHHAFGWAAHALVEEARAQVAGLIGAHPREIIFTSGATEADNLALFGAAQAYAAQGRHLVCAAFEHEAVRGPLAELERQGWSVTRVLPDASGIVDPGAVAAVLRPDTVLVSLMAAQNEIGTVQPVAEVGRICRERGVLLHTDAAQAAGKIPLDVGDLGVALLSLSAHKMYGPKGVGALYVRRRDPRVALTARQFGGGQERGLRAGTLNVAGIVGLGEACRLAGSEMAAEARRLRALRDGLWDRLQAALPAVTLNGSLEHRLPGNLNVSFAGVASHRLLSRLTVLAVSSGSACSSADTEPSAVLRSLGVPDDLARASLRLGLGRFTTEPQIVFAAGAIVAAVRELRGARP